MINELQTLRAVASANDAKLLGLTVDGLLAAAESGAPLIIMSVASRDLSDEGAELICSGVGQSAWLVMAESARLIGWLGEVDILMIASDHVPDVHLIAQSNAERKRAIPNS